MKAKSIYCHTVLRPAIRLFLWALTEIIREVGYVEVFKHRRVIFLVDDDDH